MFHFFACVLVHHSDSGSGSMSRSSSSTISWFAGNTRIESFRASADQVVEGAGGASPQLEENQLQPMDTSQSQSPTTGATKRRAETHLTPNIMEGCIGGLRSFDGDQAAEQTAMIMAFEAANDDALEDTIDDQHMTTYRKVA